MGTTGLQAVGPLPDQAASEATSGIVQPGELGDEAIRAQISRCQATRDAATRRRNPAFIPRAIAPSATIAATPMEMPTSVSIVRPLRRKRFLKTISHPWT